MRRNKLVPALTLGTMAVLAVPLRSDGGPACDNVTTSLQSTINNPIAGDEKFFTLPIGPSNVMFMLDTSGSMNNVPQCGDANTWGDSGALATCKWPTWASYGNPAPGGVTGDGTCDVAGNTNLAWMTSYTPTTTLVDPGKGTATNGLVDVPPWGTGCTGNSCLFQYNQVYADQSWTETSATPTANVCTVTFPYTDFDCVLRKDVSKTFTGTLPNCTACLSNAAGKGFYFTRGWRAAYTTNNTTGSGNSRTCTGSTTTNYQTGGGTTSSSRAYFTGGWLNANPPKFMSARKVIKEVAWIDPAVSASTDQLRLGLSYFSSMVASPNYAAIIVPLGPSAADSYPVNPPAFVAARQLILDALNHTHGGLAGWPSGITLPDLANGGTPMASALFHVGQYFTQPLTYTTAFGSATYEVAAFNQNSAGLMKAPWVSSSSTAFCWSCQKSGIIIVTDGSPNSESGIPTNTLKTFGKDEYTSATNCGAGTSCSTAPISKCCSPSDSTSSPPSLVPRVAWWLKNPTNTPSPGDLVSSLDKKQIVQVSAVSFNLPANNAQTILKATAALGGGIYNNAADGEALAAAVAQAINQVSNTSTSFGAPAATALTTINAVDTKAFITRFRPNQKATWEGHVLEWMLFDENAAGCDPTKLAAEDETTIDCRGKQVSPNFDGAATPQGYNICGKSFLVDADCDQVYEDSSTGNWYKKGQTGSDGKPLAATPFWDAGQALSDPAYDPNPNDSSTPAGIAYRSAAEHADSGNIAPVTQYSTPGKNYLPRNLWTALPNGTMYELETKNAATLAPYMNLDQAWCSSMESLARLCGASPLPSCPVTDTTGNWVNYCAKQVILFARGFDVLDQDGDGCGGPGFGISPPTGYAPNPANPSGAGTNKVGRTATGSTLTDCAISASGTIRYTGEERDRPNDAADLATSPAPTFYKLGDIFHSAPVLVHPPTSEIMCRLGVDNQCVRTIFGYTGNAKYTTDYQTGLDQYSGCTSAAGQVDAYRKWRTMNRDRQNVVLVGSNDGFLHAFAAGGADTSSDPGNKQDSDCVYPNVLDGTGEEIWGFVPPDLLPRLKDTMFNHQYMVDGNVMVRDIWVDNAPADASTGNPVSNSGNSADGVKQANEFRTIAIFGERAGGTVFTALDVTNSFSMAASTRPRPTLRWQFPPPRSEDAQYMGQSWSDTSPRPPPIGAVRLERASGDPDPQNKGWIEKWVVMINGGYDPTLNRGRAVWMVDAWTGAVHWRFTDADFKAKVLGSASNTNTSMFPVTAGISMLDIGTPGSSVDSDNFFDTATWGDLGGNLWVARFDTPGRRDSAQGNRVANWKAARAFEQGRTASDAQFATNRSEFFYMTANAWDSQRRALRTMIGSGNREQILEQGQGCGPDNLLSCCQAGCAVTTGTTLNYGVCSSVGGFACNSSGQMTSGPVNNGCGTAGASACTGGATNTFTSSSTYSMSCGTSGTSTAGGTATCDANGLCTVNPVGTGKDIVPPGATGCSTNKAKFYGIWSYGGRDAGGVPIPQKVLSTAVADANNWSTAATFDRNRFTDVPNFRAAGVCTYTADGTCSLVDTTLVKVSSKGLVSCFTGSSCRPATAADPGWYYTYNTDGVCSTASNCSAGCTNEKTASGSAIVNSCTTWNSLQPRGTAASGSDPCQGAQTAQQVAIGYSSDFITGVPSTSCNQLLDDTQDQAYRGSQRATIAPPAAPMARNSVTRGGKVYYSTLQLDPGAAATSSGSGGRDVATQLYWTEVPREDHQCRHVSSANCK